MPHAKEDETSIRPANGFPVAGGGEAVLPQLLCGLGGLGVRFPFPTSV